MKQFTINETQLDLEVVPNSKEFALCGFNPWTKALRVKVQGKAQKGQANKELVQKLEKLLQAKVTISTGGASRKKKILVKGISVKELEKKLEKLGP